jgi:hypothetical protein
MKLGYARFLLTFVFNNPRCSVPPAAALVSYGAELGDKRT